AEVGCRAAPAGGGGVGGLAVRGAASTGERPAAPVFPRPAFDAAPPLAAGLCGVEESWPGPAAPRRPAVERQCGVAAGADGGAPGRRGRLAAVVRQTAHGAPTLPRTQRLRQPPVAAQAAAELVAGEEHRVGYTGGPAVAGVHALAAGIVFRGPNGAHSVPAAFPRRASFGADRRLRALPRFLDVMAMA